MVPGLDRSISHNRRKGAQRRHNCLACPWIPRLLHRFLRRTSLTFMASGVRSPPRKKNTAATIYLLRTSRIIHLSKSFDSPDLVVLDHVAFTTRPQTLHPGCQFRPNADEIAFRYEGQLARVRTFGQNFTRGESLRHFRTDRAAFRQPLV
jgi:hypothetical protein